MKISRSVALSRDTEHSYRVGIVSGSKVSPSITGDNIDKMVDGKIVSCINLSTIYLLSAFLLS